MVTRRKLSNYLSILLLLSSALLFFFFSQRVYLEHSELWGITYAKAFADPQIRSIAIYYKSLFYLLLKPFYLFGLSNEEHILYARMLFASIASLNLYLFFRITYKITKNQFASSAMLLFLISFPLYVSQAYLTRPDTLVTTFVLLMLNYTIHRNTFSTRNKLTLAILSFFCFLVTPKAIYCLISFATYYFFLLPKKMSRLKKIEESFLLILLPVLLAITLFQFVFDWFLLLPSPYVFAINYFINSFSEYWSFANWRHFFTFIEVNFLQVSLVITAFLWFRFSFRAKISERVLAIIFFSTTLAILTLIHSEKWHFFIANNIPLLIIPVGFFLQKTIADNRRALLISLLSVLAMFNLYMLFTDELNTNIEQREAINQLERLTKSAKDSLIFDATGVLPRSKSLLQFLGPNDPTSRTRALQRVSAEKPHIIVYTAKTMHLEPEIWPLLHKNYVECSKDVWVRKEQSRILNECFNLKHFDLRSLFSYQRKKG